MAEQAVDLKGIAEVLNISVATARRRAEEGEIPGFKIGGRLWRFFPSKVVEHMSAPVDPWQQSERSRSARRAA